MGALVLEHLHLTHLRAGDKSYEFPFGVGELVVVPADRHAVRLDRFFRDVCACVGHFERCHSQATYWLGRRDGNPLLRLGERPRARDEPLSHNFET